MIGVYIHIPFCRTLCPYCDFVKRPLPDGKVPGAFIDALCREMDAHDSDAHVDSVFLGGGTPSLIAPRDLAHVMEALRQRFTLHEPEITIEVNPDDVTCDLVHAWYDAGINRVSLGVQSFDQAVLTYLGRRHDANGARRACETVVNRFDNWSMDLIFGAKPIDAWEATVRECAAFAPPHVSAYGLTYESDTPFGKRTEDAVDDEQYLALFHKTEVALPGLVRYEISNLARPGRECRHNLRYWRNESYAGFGPGAYSYLDGVRARNHSKVDRYLESPGVKTEALQLSDEEVRVETVIQHLRLRDGLPKDRYQQRFERPLDDDFGATLRELIERGLLEDNGEAVRPTRAGFELNNELGLALVAAAAR